MQAFDYIFNVGGNFQAKLDGMAKVTGEFSGKMEQVQGWAVSLAQKMAAFDLACGYIEKLVGAFDGLSAAGISLDSQMHDLSAVAGVTGESLKEIEGYARDSAKTFGTDASVAVEGYKLLLSQLTPHDIHAIDAGATYDLCIAGGVGGGKVTAQRPDMKVEYLANYRGIKGEFLKSKGTFSSEISLQVK